jgi:hypothetical protein
MKEIKFIILCLVTVPTVPVPVPQHWFSDGNEVEDRVYTSYGSATLPFGFISQVLAVNLWRIIMY